MQKVLLVDDLTNEPADETLAFVIDGEAYAIDLCAENAQAFRDAVAPYRTAARRLGRQKVSPRGEARSARSNGGSARVPKKRRRSPREWYKVSPNDAGDVKAKKLEYRQRVRAWAIENGQLRAKRGTIPREVYQAYEVWAAENDVVTGPASVGLR